MKNTLQSILFYNLKDAWSKDGMPQKSIRKLAAIMFTDMVGYTRLMQADEQSASVVRDRHRKVIKREVAGHDGEIIQYYGDGTLCLFGSSIQAVACAIQIQENFVQEPKIPLRIGIHVGDVVHNQEGIYGDGVNVASRIESLAVPGSVLFTGKVMDDIKNHPDFIVQDLGLFDLKNVQKPMQLFAVANEGLQVPKIDEMGGKGQQSSKTLAVLPFVNMSNDPENEYFSDGITEELLNSLAKVNGLKVTARSSSFVFKGQNIDIREIAKQLNVEHVLEGSVRKAGNKVRITAQLISAADGYHLWSETYDRSLEDIFAVQDEISETITKQLRKTFNQKDPQVSVKYAPTQDAKAYNLYLKGSYYLNRWSPDAVQKAIIFFKKAIEQQPDFVLPYTGLATCYIFLGVTGNAPSQNTFLAGKEAAEKALKLDDQQERSHLAIAMFKFLFERDYEGAHVSFDTALALNPSSAQAHHYFAMFFEHNATK